MTRLEESWAFHLLAAFAPPAALGLAPLPGEVDYLKTLRRMRGQSTALAALGLRLAVWIVALAPLWLMGRLQTISRLPVAERSQLLRRLLSHKILAVRELTLLLKLVAAMALLGAPSVRARSGYDNVQANTKVESGLRRKLNVLHETDPRVATDGERAVS